MVLKSQDTALQIHIEHSKPVEVADLISSLGALNALYTAYVKKNAQYRQISQSKLYVEKVKEGSIDIFLCELASATILPFLDNCNVILDFAAHLKQIYDYYKAGNGTKPVLDARDCKNLADVLNVVTSDQKGTLSIGAVSRTTNGNTYNNCTFNFGEGCGTQRLLGKEADEISTEIQTNDIRKRVLMQIYQVRNESGDSKGNKAIIDSISKRRLGVVFATDELRQKILFSDENPTQKAYWVDVELLTVGGKLNAYNVTALHDIIDIDED